MEVGGVLQKSGFIYLPPSLSCSLLLFLLLMIIILQLLSLLLLSIFITMPLPDTVG